MVNLSTGKNSTDIALAVDAIDLVLAERPDVVVIASSDSDFAPLVQRLREKGCEVRGIGQMGKTGDETQDVYDDFTVLEHRKAAPDAAAPAAKPARKRAPAAKKVAASKTAAVKKAPAKKVAAADAPARKPRTRKAAAASAAVAEEVMAVVAPAPTPPPPAPVAVVPTARSGVTLQAVLGCLPELNAGLGLPLNVAVQRLREAQLLGKNNSSLKLFAQFGDRFELLPPGKPSQVRLRA